MGINYKRLIPYRDLKEIQKETDSFRTTYWGDSIPVDIELIIEKNLGLLVIPFSGLYVSIHSEAFLTGDLKEIIYDPDISDNRIRYSIAHEVGHFILHKNAIKQLRPTSIEEWKRIELEIPPEIWGRAEFQAYEFAGRLLVPPKKLKEEIKSIQPLIDEAKEKLPDIEEPVLIDRVSSIIGRQFDVSASVVRKRIRIENIKLS